ncbi:restriction endonuclease subunit S [Amycolatopsis mediterranei]|uniref:restriction endonuclease subunit S n=1 Tax=Amycolatopsis mediterranei TaxID=33910 RepID=UPI0034279008
MKPSAGRVVVPLKDVAHVYSGGTPARANPAYWGGSVPWVTTAEIDQRHIRSSREAITELGLSASAARIAPPGTLLLAMYGQGKTRGKVAILELAASMNQACAAIEVGSRVDANYLFHYLDSRYADIRAMSNSGSQDNLSGELVRSIPVAIPPIGEQRTIAGVLNDADELIRSLERLVVKKRAIKQGLMQQLLTGRTRLAGFTDEWGVRTIASLIDGLVAGTSVRSVDGRARPAVLKTSAVRDGKFDAGEVKSILQQDVHRASCTPVADSLIISRMNTPAMVGDVGYVEHAQPGLYLPDRLWLARSRSGTGTSMRWLASLLSHGATAQAVRDLATGTSNSMKNIPKSRFLALRVSTPTSEEQHAIAEVLRNADDEISALEGRLESARAVKIGMMQELLTGRTRLPVEVVS